MAAARLVPFLGEIKKQLIAVEQRVDSLEKGLNEPLLPSARSTQSSHEERFGKLHVIVMRAHNLINVDLGGMTSMDQSDPVVDVCMGKEKNPNPKDKPGGDPGNIECFPNSDVKLFQAEETEVIKNSLNPVWFSEGKAGSDTVEQQFESKKEQPQGGKKGQSKSKMDAAFVLYVNPEFTTHEYLQVIIQDGDNFGQRRRPLGRAHFPIWSLTENPHRWANHKLSLELDTKPSQKQEGGTIEVQLLYDPRRAPNFSRLRKALSTSKSIESTSTIDTSAGPEQHFPVPAPACKWDPKGMVYFELLGTPEEVKLYDAKQLGPFCLLPTCSLKPTDLQMDESTFKLSSQFLECSPSLGPLNLESESWSLSDPHELTLTDEVKDILCIHRDADMFAFCYPADREHVDYNTDIAFLLSGGYVYFKQSSDGAIRPLSLLAIFPDRSGQFAFGKSCMAEPAAVRTLLTRGTLNFRKVPAANIAPSEHGPLYFCWMMAQALGSEAECKHGGFAFVYKKALDELLIATPKDLEKASGTASGKIRNTVETEPSRRTSVPVIANAEKAEKEKTCSDAIKSLWNTISKKFMKSTASIRKRANLEKVADGMCRMKTEVNNQIKHVSPAGKWLQREGTALINNSKFLQNMFAAETKDPSLHRKLSHRPPPDELPRDESLEQAFSQAKDWLGWLGKSGDAIDQQSESLCVVQSVTVAKHAGVFHWVQSMVAGPVVVQAFKLNLYLWIGFLFLPIIALQFATCDPDGGMAQVPWEVLLFMLVYVTTFPLLWEYDCVAKMWPAQAFLHQAMAQDDADKAAKAAGEHVADADKAAGISLSVSINMALCYTLSTLGRLSVLASSIFLVKVLKTDLQCLPSQGKQGIDGALHASAWPLYYAPAWLFPADTRLYGFAVFAWVLLLVQPIRGLLNSVPYTADMDEDDAVFNYFMNNRCGEKNRYYVKYNSFSRRRIHHESAALALADSARMSSLRRFPKMSGEAGLTMPYASSRKGANLKADFYYREMWCSIEKLFCNVLLETVFLMQIQATSIGVSACFDKDNRVDYQLVVTLSLSILCTCLNFVETCIGMKNVYSCLGDADEEEKADAHHRVRPAGQSFDLNHIEDAKYGPEMQKNMKKTFGPRLLVLFVILAIVFVIYFSLAATKLYMNTLICPCGWTVTTFGCLKSFSLNTTLNAMTALNATA